MTLFFIPCNYLVFEKVKGWFKSKFSKVGALEFSKSSEGSETQEA